jgi:hypothetical protein
MVSLNEVIYPDYQFIGKPPSGEVEKLMRISRVRFTIRRMMVATAIAAVSIATTKHAMEAYDAHPFHKGWDARDVDGEISAVDLRAGQVTVRVVTIIDLLPITIIDGSCGLHTAEVLVASSLYSGLSLRTLLSMGGGTGNAARCFGRSDRGIATGSPRGVRDAS